MFHSMESCSVHNQSFSFLLEAHRGFKCTPKVEHRVNAQPESCTTRVAVSLHEEKGLAAV